ncbi:isopentenyl transferase family protein [Nocardia sp. 2YAB30]|uniref:isopentenyl transferase family protein n=1 Tax=unclassified Nocardia TaxID=2637762 RepID=UPI003F9C5DC4
MSVRTVAPEAHVHLIVGATGVGKSARATSQARILRAPIVVADRIQCFTDLATTSACGAIDLDAQPRRHFLDERTIDQGDYPTVDAHGALRRTLVALSRENRLIIVEGGSISLLTAFFDSIDDLPFRFTAELLPIPDPVIYAGQLLSRAHRTLAPPHPEPGMLHELSVAWARTAQREFVTSIVGFGSLIRWCLHRGVRPDALLDLPVDSTETSDLAAAVAHEHGLYGAQQQRAFDALLLAHQRWRSATTSHHHNRRRYESPLPEM